MSKTARTLIGSVSIAAFALGGFAVSAAAARLSTNAASVSGITPAAANVTGTVAFLSPEIYSGARWTQDKRYIRQDLQQL